MGLPRLMAGAFALVAWAVHAHTPLPTKPNASTEHLRYESAFADYRPFTDGAIASWSKANGEAATLAGHKGQLGQMRDSTSPATPKPTATTGAPTKQAPVPVGIGVPK